MTIAPIAAIGPGFVPAFTPLAGLAPAAPLTPAALAAPASAPVTPVDAGYYLVSGPAIQGTSELSRLEQQLLEAALFAGLLDEEDEKTSPLIDLLIASAAVQMYQQIASFGTNTAVGFVGDNAGGMVGLSVSVSG
jgi:hypothetical protein